jgi:hypothetical protein
MYRIYFLKRCINVCSLDDPALADPNALEFHIKNKTDIHDLIKRFECSDNLFRIYIPSSNPEVTYKKICTEFQEVDAAGGLVKNKRGDFLLILRDGKWDLPKGHREAGEDIKTTAIREVEEETGIKGLELGELICITHHCYRRNGLLCLKHTWWYRMENNAPVDLTPQKEEDITTATWVAKSNLPAFLKTSYPSIQEVFREAKV